jgi:hypothetical protein
MRTSLKRAALVLFGAAALLAPATAPAAAAGDAAPAPVCGFYTAGGHAYYSHCSSVPVGVWVDTWDNQGEWWYCAPAWDDRHLGPTSRISWASHQQAC